MENRQDENSIGGGIHSGIPSFEEVISLENLFAAWREFKRGKTGRADVQAFGFRLEDNIFALHEALSGGVYHHGGYEEFIVCDPKRRVIHKASIVDRLVHHAVVRVIERSFDRGFIFDSWSCREGKGTHRAVDRFQAMAWTASRNDTLAVWALKLDVRKFFASVDQAVLLRLIEGHVRDARLLRLIRDIVSSFPAGLPIGNLTSQLFANVYLNELDQFVKHRLRIHGYVRYCDDFILIHTDRAVLLRALPAIRDFLGQSLQLSLHPDKIELRRYNQGVDFLGYVCFPRYRVLRTVTKRRLFRRISPENQASYLGVLRHCRSVGLQRRILKGR